MKPKKLIFASLLAVIFLSACSEKLPTEDLNLNLTQEQQLPANSDEGFVTSKQAAEIAEKFFNRESGAGTRAFTNATVEMIMDEENSNNTAMYVVNYPEGGFVVTSATRDYFPVLAYSEENSFDMETVPLSGVSVWLAETKAYIRAAESLDAEAKAQIRSQWMAYEENKLIVSSESQTRGQQEMDARIAQLAVMYPYTTTQWQIPMSLNDASSYIDYSTWQSLVSLANSYGSPPQYTIIAIRTSIPTTINIKGPLLTTAWGQGYPYNAACGPNGTPANPTPSSSPANYKVGCVAVAMGQIMNYHGKPTNTFIPSNHPLASLFHPTPGWSNVFSWSNMSISYASSMPKLLRAVGEAVYMNYGLNASSIPLSNTPVVTSAFKNLYGYTTVSQPTAHNSATVRTELNATPKGRPVFMIGVDTGGSGGHAWVCDGLKSCQDKTEYYVEFYYNNNYSDLGYYTPSNPGISLGGISYYYHMNWGWAGQYDDWFFDNNVNPGPYNLSQSRENIYVTP